MDETMYEALFFVIGAMLGGLSGVVIMSCLQINRMGKEQDYD